MRWLLCFFCLFAATVAEAGFFPFFPDGLFMKPVLPLLVFFQLSMPWRDLVTFSIVAGAMTDAYAVSVSDGAVFRFPVLMLMAFVIQKHWLTNRSLVAVVGLMAFIRLSDRGSAWFVQKMAFLGETATTFPLFSWRFFSLFLWDIVILSALFFLFHLRGSQGWPRWSVRRRI